MHPFCRLVQVLTLGTLVVCYAPADAAPDCAAVAESIKSIQSHLSDAWAAKNSGGQEELARLYAKDALNAYQEIDADDIRVCLNADGRIRLAALASKGNGLNAMLAQTSSAARRAISAEREILDMGRPYRNANRTYWNAMNADMAKIQRRYAEIANAEAVAAKAKRQAVLRITHGHDAGDAAHQIVTMDAKSSGAKPKPSNSAPPSSVRCDHPNAPPMTLRAVAPDTPAVAQQQGIQGIVEIGVSLDAYGHITGTRILSSPSAVLNAAALAATRQSTFQAEIRDCRPVASEYRFSIEFSGQ